MSSRQRTLAREISCVGEGVHTGQIVTLTLHPTKENHGIVFQRLDIDSAHARIPANWDMVRASPLCTRLVNEGGVDVYTIEHLMAALYASGIDNVLVTIDGPEVPILDGSAAPFFEMIMEAGIAELEAARRFIKVLKRIEVTHNGATAVLEPADAPAFGIEVAYPQHQVGSQSYALDLEESDFAEVASARTFGFEADLEMLRAKGLTLGGSLDNAILINRSGEIVNPEGYRFENELARHKLLDAIGDLSLAGAVIIGRFTGSRSGHTLNNALLRALFADATATVEITGDSLPPAMAAEFSASLPR